MKIFTILCYAEILFYCHAIQFNRDLVSVWFEPWLFPSDYDIGDVYGEAELTKMVQTINSKFTKIVIASIDANSFLPERSTSLIPSVVAEFNKNHPNQPTMEVTMVYYPQTNYHTNFLLTKNLTDEANSIFEETVNTLMLYYDTGVMPDNIDFLINSLENARKIVDSDKSHKYKLGAYLSITDCLFSNEDLNKLITHIDTLIFQRLLDNVEYSSEAFTSKIINNLEKCKEIMKRKEKQVNISFAIQRSDTTPGGNQSLENFIKFWDQVTNWATKTTTSVVLCEAFDNVQPQRPPDLMYAGWWRAREGMNGSLLDFVFEEKESVVKHGSAIRPPVYGNFSREHFSVDFEPWVAPYDTSWVYEYSYDFPSLMNMINTISSRFSKILIAEISPQKYSTKTCEILIPSVAGTWNKNNASNTTHPLEVVISSYGKLPPNESNFSSFDVAKIIADEGNTIYSGTVKTILIRFDPLVPLETTKAQITYSRVKTRGNKFPYKIGMIFAGSFCGQSRLKLGEIIYNIIPYLDAVHFELTPPDQVILLGVEYSFPQIFKFAERCMAKIRKENGHIGIVFHTSWPDTSDKNVKNVSALVDYWRRVNHWGEKLNTSVVLFNAFDLRNRSPPSYNTTGWWSLDNNIKHKNASEFVFVEKAEYLKIHHSEEESLNNSPESTMSTFTIMDIIIFLMFLMIIFMAAIIFYIYKIIMQKVTRLTKEEIHQFYNGNMDTSNENPDFICGAPYNKSLELSSDSFTIYESKLLGMGTFGAVFIAVIKSPEGEKHAAVKMTLTSSPSTSAKNILSEIKILSHVGLHDNIVGVIGAYTAEMYKGKVLLFMELCSNGSLQRYIRGCDPPADSTILNTDHDDLEKKANNVTFSELHKWSYEIASGMEFLAGKHIVHLDLACRNILLTENKTAKISDFGLSRRMYDYTNYFKTSQEPLPWRWMSPESLKRSEFCEKTDVWAFGVTLWEIYSFGDTPYTGLTWSVDFSQKLEQGLRLDKPRYATQEIFNIMTTCWELSSRKRPCFTDLKDKLCLEREDKIISCDEYLDLVEQSTNSLK